MKALTVSAPQADAWTTRRTIPDQTGRIALEYWSQQRARVESARGPGRPWRHRGAGLPLPAATGEAARDEAACSRHRQGWRCLMLELAAWQALRAGPFGCPSNTVASTC